MSARHGNLNQRAKEYTMPHSHDESYHTSVYGLQQDILVSADFTLHTFDAPALLL